MFDLILNFSLLIASLVALIFVADKLIDHSVKLAKILGVSGAVIGLTLLAYGTSMPEFAVSSIASFQAHDELSVSNITGSNIYNIAIVMGVVALLVPFYWKENLRRDGLFMIAATLLLIPLAFLGGISGIIGIVMVIVLAGYTYYVIKTDKKVGEDGKAIQREKGSARKEFGWCVLLLLGVVVAGYFTVQFAVESARLAGISQWIIGSTIVAAGTSMPETVVSIISARKKQMGMSLGNIVGSNYFNILWILGFAAAVNPLAFSIQNIWVDLVFLCVITALFYVALIRKKITRYEGIAYIAIYALFLLYLLRLPPFSF
ncbi:MAG: calcium/sodium antiporter [Candidatus Aenigmarchaeota archaeon]|nr:calcium/sodium antiporter [Candidatus Aenigmarchaeota archaeon]